MTELIVPECFLNPWLWNAESLSGESASVGISLPSQSMPSKSLSLQSLLSEFPTGNLSRNQGTPNSDAP